MQSNPFNVNSDSKIMVPHTSSLAKLNQTVTLLRQIGTYFLVISVLLQFIAEELL